MEMLKSQMTSDITKLGKYAPNSVNIIVSGLTNVICGISDIKTYDWTLFNDTELVVKYLDSIENANTRKSRSSSIKIYTCLCGYPYTEEVKKIYTYYFDQLANHIDAIRLGHSDNLTEKDMVIKQEWHEIREKVKEYELNKDENMDNYMKYYIASIYTSNPPLRPGEWTSSIFSEKDDGQTNHINVKNGTMKIYQQKSKTYKYREFKLSPKLLKVFNEFREKIVKTYGKRGLEYVIPTYRYGYGSSNPNNLSKQIMDVFGVNANTLRHIYESTIVSIGPSTRIYVAYVMGHTLETQAMDYAIYGKYENKSEKDCPFDLIEEKMH